MISLISTYAASIASTFVISSGISPVYSFSASAFKGLHEERVLGHDAFHGGGICVFRFAIVPDSGRILMV
eukprot:scaffold5675_cov151-Amphora_coffeaeformis.AAC.3